MTFFNFDRLLVTVRAADSRTVAQVKSRFVNLPGKMPQSPDDLMQRLLSAMVDHYLELRQPLARRLDEWQLLLLDPRKPFHDWGKLLESRQQIREVQNLSEEQRDAVQEWRDYRIADLSPAMHARFTDIVEHIERVLNHAHTIEHQAESAVQLYFAAMSHRTTEIMRLLTLITAIFMPLTLITGVFGMNFDVIPGLHKASASGSRSPRCSGSSSAWSPTSVASAGSSAAFGSMPGPSGPAGGQKDPNIGPSAMTATSASIGADDADHHDVEVALPVRRAAHGEQRDHRAVVRQAVERAGADHRDAVHQRGIDALLRGDLHVGRAQRVQRDGQAAGGRAGQRRQDVGGDRERDQRPAADAEHPVAHRRERRHRRHHRAEADQARDAEDRQHRRVGAGVDRSRAARAAGGS